MKIRFLLPALLLVGLLYAVTASQGQAFELLDRMLHVNTGHAGHGCCVADAAPCAVKCKPACLPGCPSARRMVAAPCAAPCPGVCPDKCPGVCPDACPDKCPPAAKCVAQPVCPPAADFCKPPLMCKVKCWLDGLLQPKCKAACPPKCGCPAVTCGIH